MNWLRWRHRLEYLVFRLLICVVQMLSAARSREFAEALAFVLHRVLPRKLTRYGVARDNLRQALGPGVADAEIDEHIRGMWVHLFRVVIEVAQLPRKLRHENLLDVVVYDGGRRASWQAFNSGRPVMLVGGHFGNWEVANAVFGLLGTPLGVVARDLDNPYLHDWFQHFRVLSGHGLISKNGASAAMLQLLERRGHLALLCDQDAGPRGVFVDFFGKPASTYKSIALLAIEYRTIIVVGGALRLPDGSHREDCVGPPWVRFQLCSEDVIDPLEFEGSNAVEEITRRYTSALERLVSRAPEQYFWVHRRWKSQPQPRRSAKKAA
jgi:KDO2-lipid IV(A) lauroyltransferase